MVILAGVVLGPVLTLIVFDIRKGRKVLTRDMLVIIALQLGAFVWGVHVSYLGRPAYLAFSVDVFHSVSLGEIDEKALPDNIPRVKSFSSPEKVYVRPVTDPEERTRLIFGYMEGRIPDIHYLADRYLPFGDHLDDVLARAWNIHKTVSTDPVKQQVLDEFLHSKGMTVKELAFYPAFSHGKEGALAIERKTGKVVGYLAMEL